MNLRNYTYEHYMASHEPAEKTDKEEANVKGTVSEDMTEPGESTTATDFESEIKTEPAAATDAEKAREEAAKKEQEVNEEYEYNLSGVIVHLGSADIGHYYSYINVNRNDPSRPQIVEDKWIEFNDSTIRNFKISDLEEECFGTKEDTRFTRFDDDFENFFGGRGGGKFNIDKCAYILVYEKVKKRSLNFVFTEETLNLKDLIMANIAENRLDKVEFSKSPDDLTYNLKVGFYDLKPYSPERYRQSIKEDNFKFLIEQHVYSRDFLQFITNLSDIKEIPEFDPLKLPTGIFETELSPESKAVIKDCLDANVQFIFEVFSKTDDSQYITKFSNNICRMISVCPEKAIEIIRTRLIPNGCSQVMNIFTDCPEAVVRHALADIIGHTILVAVNHLKIPMDDAPFVNPLKDQEKSVTDQNAIKFLLRYML